jgi:hypothetical protein
VQLKHIRKISALKSILLAMMMACGATLIPTLGVSESRTPLKVVEGDWVRTDGAYSVQVRNIQPAGSVEVKYFNPDPIHISDANVGYQKELVKLFFKLDDREYPGSTYTLYYYVGKDALAGFYYQAVQKQTYEVVFIRKPAP